MLFGTSGIRGLYGKDVTAGLALKVGAALGSRYQSLVVGHDQRLSSPLLYYALVSGALGSGAEVFELGMVPTPVAAYAGSTIDAPAAVITASHNPPEYNGIKLHLSNGAGFGPDDCMRIEHGLEDQVLPASWDNLNEPKDMDGVTRYLKGASDKIGNHPGLKVIVDCNHGTAGVVSPLLLQKTGMEVEAVQSEPDGRWKPTSKHDDPRIGDWGSIVQLSDLIKKVKKSGVDLGIVHDGDADRAFFVTRDGPVVPDKLIAAVAKVTGLTPVVSVDASMVVDEVAKTIRVPVGDVAISQALIGKRKMFGAEPSGTFIWCDWTLCPDGPYSAAMIASLWPKLHDVLEELPDYPMKRMRLRCDNKEAVMQRVKEKALKMGAKVTTIDGVRVETDDGWFLVRPSGTEPVMRIMAEAHKEKALDAIMKQATSLVK